MLDTLKSAVPKMGGADAGSLRGWTAVVFFELVCRRVTTTGGAPRLTRRNFPTTLSNLKSGPALLLTKIAFERG